MTTIRGALLAVALAACLWVVLAAVVARVRRGKTKAEGVDPSAFLLAVWRVSRVVSREATRRTLRAGLSYMYDTIRRML